MGLFEPQHLIVVLVIALIIFGPGKISDLGGSLGRGIRDFKKAMAEPTELPAPAAAEARPTPLQSQQAHEETVTIPAAQIKETA
jgi:sec-independent protein translocase protein TatA